MYRMIAQSEGVDVGEGFNTKFKSLWQLEEKEKAEIAEIDGRTYQGAVDGGLIIPATAMRGLRRSSTITGRFADITDDVIAAEEELGKVPTPVQVEKAEEMQGEEPGAEEHNPTTPSGKGKDSIQ